jgi:hypothetical protein
MYILAHNNNNIVYYAYYMHCTSYTIASMVWENKNELNQIELSGERFQGLVKVTNQNHLPNEGAYKLVHPCVCCLKTGTYICMWFKNLSIEM